MRFNAVDVFSELMAVLFLLDNKGVINIGNSYPGGLVVEQMALISSSSMNSLATMGLMGEPMAALCTCSKNLPWKKKYVFLRQNSNNVVM